MTTILGEYAMTRVSASRTGILAALAGVVLACLASGTLAYEPPVSDYLRATDPALGISIEFGRWNSQINLVYDPDGAPAPFGTSAVVIDLIEQAIAQWELVSGIKINITGTDRFAAIDENAGPSGKDGLVRVFWGPAGGAAGLAGPDGDFFDEDLGYFPYIDGSVELNDDPDQWDSPSELVGVLVHELGHLIGLGHSDNPHSVMFANPYNHLNHPRPDDILAARALYGNGTLNISDVTKPVSQWLYTPPPAASAGTTADLFKANSIFELGSFIAIDSDLPLTDVDASTKADDFLWFYYAIGPNNSRAIDIDATIVFVDPFGYLYESRQRDIECQLNFSCAAGVTVGETNVVKSVPGTWTIYVIDNAFNTLLHKLNFDVNTTNVFNAGPVANVSVTSVSSNVVNIRLDVSDAEGDAIEVVWHPQSTPSAAGITDKASDGSTVSRDITFPTASTHTLYIELRDDAARYDGSRAGSGGAGDGFQNLIAITVDLPIADSGDVHIRQSYLGGSPGAKTGQALVNAIAKISSLQLITTSDGSSTSAKFEAGASKDGGVTTGTIFNAGDDIVIAGSVSPQIGDIGLSGEVFVVLYTSSSLSYLDIDGNFVRWGGSLKNLQPAFERTDLLTSESFEVFSGMVESGLYRIFMGYRVTEGEGGPIHFNAKAFRVTVN